MAHISEIAYKETRNPDGSLFSQQMEARCILNEGELPYPLDERDPADAVVLRQGGLLVEFVRKNLDMPFERADEKLAKQALPPQLPPKDVPKEQPKQQQLPASPPPGASAPSSAQPQAQGKITGPAGPAYDREKLKWNYCPSCKSADVTHRSNTGKVYQGCFECQMFLQADGKTRPMTGAKA